VSPNPLAEVPFTEASADPSVPGAPPTKESSGKGDTRGKKNWMEFKKTTAEASEALSTLHLKVAATEAATAIMASAKRAAKVHKEIVATKAPFIDHPEKGL
jgi:hypothetical protein